MLKISIADYEKAARLAEIAKGDLERRLGKTIRLLGNPDLVRAHIAESRIKKRGKVEEKAKRNGWLVKEALRKATDLVGIRVVCNNVQDVNRAADLFEGALREDRITVSRQDYVAKPGPDGYRAIHLDVRVPISLYSDTLNVGCEIQIRSFLQDTWARLSRVDLYHSKDKIPKNILARMGQLAKQLAKADKQADEIRNQLVKKRRGRAPSTKGAKLNKGSIAFLYRRAFGNDPPAYLVDFAFDRFGNIEIRADGLDQALHDKKLLRQLESAYQAQIQREPSPEELFQWVVISVARGKRTAIREARDAGRLAWEEVDQFYLREIASSLPNTVDELIKELESSWEEPDIGEWAVALGATSECSICSTAIIHADTFAEAAVEHYELSESKADKAHQRIESAIDDSGVEIGDPLSSSSLCSYHAHQVSKDD